MSVWMPVTREGVQAGRRTIGDIGRAFIEPADMEDRNQILLPEEMRQHRIDFVLLLVTLALFGVGLVMVFSSTSFVAQMANSDPYKRFIDQAARGLVGLVGLIGLARIDYRRLSGPGFWVALGGVFLLAALFIPGIGHSAKGAQRWIVLGPLRLQPTEIARVALIVYLARLLSKPPAKMERFTTGPLPALLATGAVMGMILVQPSLGSSLALGVTSVCMCLVAGMRWRHFFLLAGAVGLAGLLALVVMLLLPHAQEHSYQLGRFGGWKAYWSGTDDPLGATYQLRQSLLTLGSGQWHGLGLGESQQKKFFLPDAHTDFIFSILGEETGFIGAFGLLIAFAIFIGRGLRIAGEAEDRFGYLLAAGLTINFAVYITINISVTMGLLPVTGLPLPFVSYGGSALIANLLAVGLLLSISRRRGAYVLGSSRRRKRGIL